MMDVQLTKSLHSAQGPIRLDVSFTIETGEFVALYGPSGAGKTTVLRMLAGLDRPESGYIRSDEKPWYDGKKATWIPPQQRPVGVVFQDYALFPNMSIREQVAFALPDKRNVALVDELLAIMNLTALGARRPGVLSGGQQQRVALARAVARQPRLLLLDEPLSALDAETRGQLQEEIGRLHRQFGLTTVLVSHDTAEITQLADRVITLDAGKITGQGPPATVLASPNPALPSSWVGTVVALQRQGTDLHLTLHADGVSKTLVVPEASIQVGDRIVVLAAQPTN